MIKTTIEMHRKKDTTAGIGHCGIPYAKDSTATLDRLLEWAQENPTQKVYRHLVRVEEENLRHEPHSWENPEFVYPNKCDYVTYLDIYHQ